MAEQCWICGGSAETREHRIKASDLKGFFGPISPEKPLFMHGGGIRNRKIKGKTSLNLKYARSLCAVCNNERTQKHDKAWEDTASFLRSEKSPIKTGLKLDLKAALGENFRERITDLQLFFVKQLGCLVIEGDAPIDLALCSKSIIENTAHPHVYLKFIKGFKVGELTMLSRSALTVASVSGKIISADFFYILDDLAVFVLLARPNLPLADLMIYAMQPNIPKRRHRIVHYNE